MHTRARVRAHTRAHTHTHTHNLAHTHTGVRTYTHTHTRTRTCAHARTHAHTQRKAHHGGVGLTACVDGASLRSGPLCPQGAVAQTQAKSNHPPFKWRNRGEVWCWLAWRRVTPRSTARPSRRCRCRRRCRRTRTSGSMCRSRRLATHTEQHRGQCCVGCGRNHSHPRA